jgi:hypothetical protein
MPTIARRFPATVYPRKPSNVARLSSVLQEVDGYPLDSHTSRICFRSRMKWLSARNPRGAPDTAPDASAIKEEEWY